MIAREPDDPVTVFQIWEHAPRLHLPSWFHERDYDPSNPAHEIALIVLVFESSRSSGTLIPRRRYGFLLTAARTALGQCQAGKSLPQRLLTQPAATPAAVAMDRPLQGLILAATTGGATESRVRPLVPRLCPSITGLIPSITGRAGPGLTDSSPSISAKESPTLTFKAKPYASSGTASYDKPYFVVSRRSFCPQAGPPLNIIIQSPSQAAASGPTHQSQPPPAGLSPLLTAVPTRCGGSSASTSLSSRWPGRAMTSCRCKLTS